MFYYAQLNNDNICIGISSLTGYVEMPNMISIPSYDQDYVWRKFENGVWSVEKFKPIPPTPEPNELDLLKEKVQNLEEYLDEHEAALIEIVNMIVGGEE